MVELNIKQLCIIAILIFIIYHLSANQYNGFSVDGKVNNFKNYLPYCNTSLNYHNYTIKKSKCTDVNVFNGDCSNHTSYEFDEGTGYLCGEILDTSMNNAMKEKFNSQYMYNLKCKSFKDSPVCNNNCYSLFDNTMTAKKPEGCFQTNTQLCKKCLLDYLNNNNPDNLKCDEDKMINWCLNNERV
tara:strand:- start:2746 stop:3300 length:555 start_codon:yes stop_codon:yes gene_type:complete